MSTFRRHTPIEKLESVPVKLYRKAITTAVATLAVAFFATTATAADDIVTTAVKNGNFKTLAAAVKAAGLVEALQGEGPFTVFAPTDAAFAKLPKGTVETLLKPENKGKLAGILTFHVVPGKVMAADAAKVTGAVTLNGQRVDIDASNGVTVDGAQVVTADIACSNGVIHVIDSVMLPADKNLVETADAAGTFKTLLTAAKAAGLADALTGDGPLTVFAPNDAAFAKLPEGTVANLLKPENKSQLVAILKYHVVSGRVYSDAAVAAGKAATLQGQPVEITVSGGAAMVNSAKLLATDLDASNGVIHVVDSVLMPPADKTGAVEKKMQKIEHAVATGSKLFNNGHHAECAKVYTSTMHELLQSDMPASIAAPLKRSLESASHISCPTSRSWAMRHALTHAYTQMQPLK